MTTNTFPAQIETAENVLNGIREAMESRGYIHMANGRDIGHLLDKLDALESDPSKVLFMKRVSFKKANANLDLNEDLDAFGRPQFKCPNVRAIWEGWITRADIA